jgi:hypothetical protein
VLRTKVLIIYQIYHSWIRPLHCSPLSLSLHSWNKFNRSHFSIYTHVLLLLHHFISGTWCAICREKVLKEHSLNEWRFHAFAQWITGNRHNWIKLFGHWQEQVLTSQWRMWKTVQFFYVYWQNSQGLKTQGERTLCMWDSARATR